VKFATVVFLEVEEVERIHLAAISAAGGSAGLRDRGLLESAVYAPQTTVFGAPAHPSLARMAAALAYALAKNHAFVDGNKRVAALGAITFLTLNGYTIQLPRDPWADVFDGLADGAVTRDDLAALLAREMGKDELVED
jgi:death on curing protein